MPAGAPIIGRLMATETTAAMERPPPGGARADEAHGPNIETRAAAGVLALLPGALVLYFGFNGGGFFPGTPAFACLIVIQFLLLRIPRQQRHAGVLEDAAAGVQSSERNGAAGRPALLNKSQSGVVPHA